MIDPREPLKDIFGRHPFLRHIYEASSDNIDETGSTEDFCESNGLDFFSFWSKVSSELFEEQKKKAESTKAILDTERKEKEKSERRKALKEERRTIRKQKYNHRRWRDLSDSERKIIVLSDIFMLFGCGLFFFGLHNNNRFLQAVGIGLAVTTSSSVASIWRRK